jgi:diguanylate cyclase (GGDEF)-like protein/PAS domain S-box-containing protein
MFLAAGLAAAVGQLWLPGDLAPSVEWDLIGAVSVLAFAVGIHRNRPPNPTAWRLFGLGIALFVAGDVAWDVAVYAFGHSSNTVPASDALYLSAYPFLALGLVKLAGFRGRGRAVIVDTVVVSLAAGGLLWEVCIAPTIDSATGSTWDRATTLAYPIMDVVLVVAVIYTVLSVGRWVPAAGLLVAGMACQLVGDSVYARLAAENMLGNAHWLDAIWPASYVLVAAAALHPTMRLLGGRATQERVGVARLRVSLLGLALFVAPAVALLAKAQGRDQDAVGLGIVTGLVAALLVWRLDSLVGETNRAYDRVHDSEERFRALVQHASDVVTVVDAQGCIEYISPSVLDVLGKPPIAFLGTQVGDHLHSDDLARATKVLVQVLRDPGHMYSFEARAGHADGSWRWLETTCSNQIGEASVRGIVGNFRDVSERKRTEALEAAEAKVLGLLARGAPLVESLNSLIGTVEDLLGAMCSIRLVDPATGRLSRTFAPSLPTSYLEALDAVALTPVTLAAAGEVVSFSADGSLDADSANDDDRPGPEHDGVVVIEDVARDSLWPEVCAAASAHDLHLAWALQVCAADGGQVLASFTVYWPDGASPGAPERSLLGRWTHLAAIAIDHSRSQERLGFLAMHDALTGLPNRALVIDRLSHALTRLDRRPATLAVLFLDLDRFKLINDSLGHEVGDQVLVAIAERLTNAVREVDTVARFGGDEFLVLCEDLESAREAEELAERAAQTLAEPIPLSRGEVVVSASIGIAIAHRSSAQPASLLRDADAAMYRAKALGGARHEVFDQAMHTDAISRLLTERALRRAVDRKQLRVYLQPQVDLATAECVAVEALVRWQHPMRGVVEPAQFIPIAEETGLIVPIGSWVLEETCRWSGDRTTSETNRLGISVNLSARQLLRADLRDQISQLLERYAIPAESLCLEITESVLLDDVDATGDALLALRALGIRFAIDDFGTGYSSLTYLRRFPFDQLKIDRSFVAGLGTSTTDDAIVAAAIDMAHALDMVVAAEGVETAAQLDRLVELGCDLAQGYHVAMPRPMETYGPDVEDLLGSLRLPA